jgi:excisionase family DNA binding protein
VDTASSRVAGTTFRSAERAAPELERPVEQPGYLLTRQQVAEILQVSERTVRRAVQRGELAEIRVTETVGRFAPADVEAFIAAKREQRERDRSDPVTFRRPGRSRKNLRDHRRFVDRARDRRA